MYVYMYTYIRIYRYIAQAVGKWLMTHFEAQHPPERGRDQADAAHDSLSTGAFCRTVGRLEDEARKVREVLSANTHTAMSVNDVLPGLDFSYGSTHSRISR